MQAKSNPSARRTGAPRLGAVAGPALVGAFLLASCGGGESAATQSTIDLSASSTAFVVRPPATTEPPADTAGGGGAVIEGTQEYEVQSGDYPYKLVNDFGITLEDLINVNEWGSENEFPGPGTVILIPPGGKAVADVAAGTAETDTAETEGDAETEGETEADAEASTETIPDAGDNCGAGKHVIAEGDYEGKVATQYDVTVDALRAANAGTSGYSAFYPGLEIVIPAKADC